MQQAAPSKSLIQPKTLHKIVLHVELYILHKSNHFLLASQGAVVRRRMSIFHGAERTSRADCILMEGTDREEAVMRAICNPITIAVGV